MPTPSDRTVEALAREIEESLKATSPGGIVASSRLWRELGFVSLSAMRRAVASGRLTMPVFEMEGRRGLFVRRAVLARYLAEQELRGQLIGSAAQPPDTSRPRRGRQQRQPT